MVHDSIYKKRKDFFNAHAHKWDDMWYKDKTTREYNRHKKAFDRLFTLLPLKKGDWVLDVGCGTGILVPYIIDHTKGHVMLCELDYAYEMLKINRCFHGEKNIFYILSDAEYIPFKTQLWNLIICFSSFPHFHNKKNAMLSLSRTLKKGGYFIVSHFDSSEDLNKHHLAHEAVMHDVLPDETTMRHLFDIARLHINTFIDEKGFYFIMAEKF